MTNIGFKDLKLQIRKNATMREVMDALAKGVAEASIDAQGVLIGPLVHRQTGELGVHLVFSHPQLTAETMWVALGPLPADAPVQVREHIISETRKHLHKSLRKRFDEVTTFTDLKELTSAAVVKWPCARTIAFKGDGPEFTDIEPFREH